MLSKLLSLLSTAKGAAAATAIAAAAVSTGVAATDQDVRDAVTNTVQNLTDAKDVGQPAVVTARNKADSDLRAAIAKLTPVQQEVMVLMLEDRSVKEIARLTGKREGTIRGIHMRALEALREMLGEVRS